MPPGPTGVTRHATDAAGVFHFELSPEQAAEPRVYLELDFRHPGYAPRTGQGYGLGLIRRDLELGQKPWFRRVELSPGEEVRGAILDPDGHPLAGAVVRFVSISGPSEMRLVAMPPQRCDDRVTTDESGHFRFNAIRGAAITEFFVETEQYAPLYYNVRDLRGDVGTFRLHYGVPVTGVVLDAAGAPVPHVGVTLESIQRSEVQWPLARRHAETGDDGRFTFQPVPPGAYDLEVVTMLRKPAEDGGQHYRDVRLPGAFVPQRVIAEFLDYNVFPPVEVRALPDVKVRVQYVDGSGNPCRGHGAHFIAKHEGRRFSTRGVIDEHGTIELSAPKGVTEAKLLIGTDPYSSLRFRRGATGDPRAGPEIELGTLDADVDDLLVVRHKAPVLIVRAVSTDGGQPVADFKPRILYPPGTIPPMNGEWISGVKGDVNLQPRDDGSWHSSQLLPDQPFTISVNVPGFAPASRELNLREGEVHEITFELTPAAAKDFGG
jgi:hypothetical protein